MLTDGQDIDRPDDWKTLGPLAFPVEDHRLPAPDVLGHLADRLIRRCDLSLVAEEVRRAWPNVTAVQCGVYNSTPYFSIHIRPFSREAQRDHWPLADWIEATLDTKDSQYFFLPAAEEEPYSSEITIYRASDNRRAA